MSAAAEGAAKVPHEAASGTLVMTVSSAPVARATSSASASARAAWSEPSIGTRMLLNTARKSTNALRQRLPRRLTPALQQPVDELDQPGDGKSSASDAFPGGVLPGSRGAVRRAGAAAQPGRGGRSSARWAAPRHRWRAGSGGLRSGSAGRPRRLSRRRRDRRESRAGVEHLRHRRRGHGQSLTAESLTTRSCCSGWRRR
jgi:hypothetical protein